MRNFSKMKHEFDQLNQNILKFTKQSPDTNLIQSTYFENQAAKSDQIKVIYLKNHATSPIKNHLNVFLKTRQQILIKFKHYNLKIKYSSLYKFN